MTSVDINYFDLLSNELIAEVVNFLDLQSLFRLASTCNQLCEFKEISNEQWRRYYAQKWLVDEKELAIYTTFNWQQRYRDRIKSENDYLSVINSQTEYGQNKNDIEESYKAIMNPKYRIVPKDNGENETYYDPTTDPWAILLRANSQKINPPPTIITACVNCILGFFEPPFTVSDQEREVWSGRFEILVTTMAKYAFTESDITLVFVLEMPIFQSRFYLERHNNITRRMPIGMLGLLTKNLNLTVSPRILTAAMNILWEAAAAGLIDEDMFVGMGIVTKLIDLLMKGTDEQVNKSTALVVLTWFNPFKAQNKKVMVNAPFMHYLIDQLSIVTAESTRRRICGLLSNFGEYNGSIVNETRLVFRLMDFVRNQDRDNARLLSHLLCCISNLCLYESNNSCIKLVQSESDIEYLFSLIKQSDDEDMNEVANRALNVIRIVARNEICAERLLEMNALDRLLPFIEDPTNTHLFKDLYYSFNLLIYFVDKWGIEDEVFPKLLRHKDALLERGYSSNDDAVRDACDEFWMTFSCMTAPPRDVSIKLIDRAMPLILDEKTKLRMKMDAAILLANIVETDSALFENKDLLPLFNYLTEYFINYDYTKELAALSDNVSGTQQEAEKENEKNQELSDEGDATTALPSVAETSDFLSENNLEEDGEDENDDEDDNEAEAENDGEDYSDEAENEDEANAESKPTESNNEDDNKFANESPWPLNLLSQIVRFDYVQEVAIQNEKFIDKLFSMLNNKACEFEGHFLGAYIFSFLINKPGWDSAKALQYIEDFAIKCEYDVEWNFFFALLEPYSHLLRKDNPEPLIIFGSWFLAHMSTLESGRQILKKDLDPSIVTWMKSHPHARVQHNINQFTRNMQKKSRREH